MMCAGQSVHASSGGWPGSTTLAESAPGEPDYLSEPAAAAARTESPVLVMDGTFSPARPVSRSRQDVLGARVMSPALDRPSGAAEGGYSGP
jgi:hypothetical protein